MKLTDNTILITGGSDGIGLELARSLVSANTVIICGRSETKLARARSSLPALKTLTCDLTVATQRNDLVDQVVRAYPRLNLLINNAGGRRCVDLSVGEGYEAAMAADIELNFVAPVALCQGFLAHLREQPRAAMVNVTTGLAYLPKAAYPFYCAAKTALHSYTQSLRWTLRHTPLEVIEVLMPLVDTAFHEGRLPQTTKALTPAQAAGQALRGIAASTAQIHVGKAGILKWFAALAPAKGLAVLNKD